jgi:hypothetical protein
MIMLLERIVERQLEGSNRLTLRGLTLPPSQGSRRPCGRSPLTSFPNRVRNTQGGLLAAHRYVTSLVHEAASLAPRRG